VFSRKLKTRLAWPPIRASDAAAAAMSDSAYAAKRACLSLRRPRRDDSSVCSTDPP
jgi:hypothetical protein